MNAFEVLKKQHREVSDLFERLKPFAESSPQNRQQVFPQIKEKLDIHTQIEETIFYPTIRKAAETHQITLEGFVEHHVIKMLLRELEGMDIVTDQWAAKLQVLNENVEHHVEEEEDEMFGKARDVLSQEQLNQIGAQLQEETKRLEQQRKSSAAGR